ncbi:alpha/beta fold hydrolase [Phenylobacterium sp.]|uniref:alpha/beta fold hydrolase n=1 Tax=Phenylobacterium sp. TaxID=1871053 RepID=UPI002734DEFC|nr:alpha/beta hydrolase [Phenylobacterium sp.]MDP3659697.1 alpha/beta hydrolase [Phenylobacterium sp.]
MVGIMDNIKDYTLDLDDSQAHVLEAGSGYPTIFLHGAGFTNSAEAWLPCLKEGLADSVHVYAIDHVGAGYTSRREGRYEFGFLVDHVREVQDALGFEKTNIVGHSLGGWVGGVLAYESPERVNKLVLAANAGLNVQPPAGVAERAQLPSHDQLAQDLAGIADDEVRAAMLEARKRIVDYPNAAETYDGVGEMFGAIPMRKRYYLTRRLGRIKAPTLLIYGENDLHVPSPEGRKVMHEGIKGSQMVVMPDTGHSMITERPREVVKMISDFLNG